MNTVYKSAQRFTLGFTIGYLAIGVASYMLNTTAEERLDHLKAAKKKVKKGMKVAKAELVNTSFKAKLFVLSRNLMDNDAEGIEKSLFEINEMRKEHADLISDSNIERLSRLRQAYKPTAV